MGEKKPSSLRTRIDRTRQTYDRKTNPAPIIIGVSFIFVVGLVLYFVAFSTPPTPHKKGNYVPKNEMAMPAKPNYGPASGRTPMPKSDEQSAYEFVDAAKRTAREGDIEKAVQQLKSSLGKWPKYDAELYFAMAMCVGERETKLQGEPLRQMWAEKYNYYQKTLDLINAGGKFAYGKHSVRVNNLKTAIRVAKDKAGM